MNQFIAWLFVGLVLSLGVVVTENRPASACSCVGLSDAEALAHADTVFTGEVVGYQAPSTSRSDELALWTFKAREVYKGEVGRIQEVSSEYLGASCGLEIPKTGEFLVFGSTQSLGPRPILGAVQLYAGLCGGTRSVGEGALQAGLAKPRVLPGRSYALPTDGWRPGDNAMFAATSGEFHAGLTPDGACARLRSGDSAFLWPAGYRVRFDPTRLIDAKGRVVAKEGDVLGFGGGYAPAPAGTRCVAADERPWHVQSSPLSR